MGLFDRFGAGGGKLELQPSSSQFAPGQVLEGRVVFTGGSRAQQITHIKLKLTSSTTQMAQTPQGPQQRSHSADVAPEVQLSGAFASQPSQRYEFPFSIQLPAQMVSSTPQLCSYHLAASADIDNEIDPGAGTAIQIVGGMPAGGMGQPMMGGMPGQMGQMGQPMMGQPMMGQPMMGGMPGQMGQPMMGQMGQPMMGGMPGQMGALGAVVGAMAGQMGQMGQPMMGGMPGQMPQQAPIGVGSHVLAQWQDGQFHAGTVVQMQNGYLAVDWQNPQLGVTSWVLPTQVQPMPGQMGQMGQPMMGGMPGQMGQPMMGGVQPQYGQPAMHAATPMKDVGPSGGSLQTGSSVWAQSPDGNWNPAKIVSIQNGYYAVDWENSKLGPTAWVGEAQIKPR